MEVWELELCFYPSAGGQIEVVFLIFSVGKEDGPYIAGQSGELLS